MEAINKFLNIMFVIFLIMGGFFWYANSGERTPQAGTGFVNYSECKNMIQRPVEHTIWGDVSTGYDCGDDK